MSNCSMCVKNYRWQNMASFYKRPRETRCNGAHTNQCVEQNVRFSFNPCFADLVETEIETLENVYVDKTKCTLVVKAESLIDFVSTMQKLSAILRTSQLHGLVSVGYV